MNINYDELVGFNEIKEDTPIIDEIIEYEEILLAISNCIKEYRKENGLTQKQLAKKLHFDQVMISKLESGNYNPTFKQIHKISRKLTNSTDLFIETLKKIIDNLNDMYKLSYNVTIKENELSKKKDRHIIYLSQYSYEYNEKGGSYGTEKCTSSISVAG